MIQCVCKAIIYEDFEDVYGPCGCGMTLATLPVLLPRDWVVLERPHQAECDDFCKGLDYRRISGLSASRPNTVLNRTGRHTTSGNRASARPAG